MKKALFIILLSNSLLAIKVDLKEAVRVTSFRENQVIGYGLVVGLPQSGDSRSILADDALRKMLNYRGIKIPEKNIKSRNVAAVMVMAKIPPFAREGMSIDIWVSSIGDAKSLKGGYLLQTPLTAADGKTYAVAQTSISPNVINKDNQYFSNTENNRFRASRLRSRNNTEKVTTVHIPGGAVMERRVVQPLNYENVKDKRKFLKLSLLHFNVLTAQNIIDEINKIYPKSAALQKSDGTVTVEIPNGKTALSFLSELMQIKVDVRTKARVVIDPRSATIIMGEAVGVSPVSVTKNGITIKVLNDQKKEARKEINTQLIPETTNVGQLINTLNNLGLRAEDIIDVIKAIYAAGALHAELIIL